MADPLVVEGLEGLSPEISEICTIEACCVTGFEPMAQEEIKVNAYYVVNTSQYNTRDMKSLEKMKLYRNIFYVLN